MTCFTCGLSLGASGIAHVDILIGKKDRYGNVECHKIM